MRILVTGGGGFIGSNTVDLLLKQKHQVLVVDNFSTGKMENLSTHVSNIEVADICDMKGMDDYFDRFRPEAVLHLAGQSAISTAWTLPEVDAKINAIGTLNLVQAARVYGVKKFVFSSTSAVYGKSKSGWVPAFGTAFFEKMPMDENCKLEPDTPYGISKLAAEHYIRLMFPNHVIFRYANIYGPRQQPIGDNQLVARAFRHFIHGDDFKIVGDGKQKRDFVYVEDVCHANLMALTGSETGTFNVASGQSHSVNEVLREVELAFGVPGYKWEHTEANDERGGVYMNGNLIRNRFGWTPRVSLKQGIELTAKAWEGNGK